MASTSPRDRALELLGYCLRGERWPAELLDGLLADEASEALVRVVAEGLADRFERRLVDIYCEIFSQAIARSLPECDAGDLQARYQRVRQPRKLDASADRVRTVFVLSRVTLGADVAVTSVLLDAAKRRFPDARIVLAGSRKSWELFAADPRVEHLLLPVIRLGSLRERLSPWREMQALLSQPDSIVIDPDSRLTQLGLLPVCPEENYYFFESRSYGGDGHEALPELARRWAAATLGVEDASPYIAPAAMSDLPEPPVISVSLGVGENPAKRIADPFEAQLLAHLAETGALLCIDRGAGGEEAERVDRAILLSGIPARNVRVYDGSFAGFASIIARSQLYAGYDSAGQHVAAACGVPLLSIFAGFASQRMFERWRPTGRGCIEVVKVNDADPTTMLRQVVQALAALR